MSKRPLHAYNDECPSCVRELATPKEWRGGTIRALGILKGWVMVRKRGAAPFVMTWRDFYALPDRK